MDHFGVDFHKVQSPTNTQTRALDFRESMAEQSRSTERSTVCRSKLSRCDRCCPCCLLTAAKTRR